MTTHHTKQITLIKGDAPDSVEWHAYAKRRGSSLCGLVRNGWRKKATIWEGREIDVSCQHCWTKLVAKRRRGTSE